MLAQLSNLPTATSTYYDAITDEEISSHPDKSKVQLSKAGVADIQSRWSITTADQRNLPAQQQIIAGIEIEESKDDSTLTVLMSPQGTVIGETTSIPTKCSGWKPRSLQEDTCGSPNPTSPHLLDFVVIILISLLTLTELVNLTNGHFLLRNQSACNRCCRSMLK